MVASKRPSLRRLRRPSSRPHRRLRSSRPRSGRPPLAIRLHLLLRARAHTGPARMRRVLVRIRGGRNRKTPPQVQPLVPRRVHRHVVPLALHLPPLPGPGRAGPGRGGGRDERAGDGLDFRAMRHVSARGGGV